MFLFNKTNTLFALLQGSTVSALVVAAVVKDSKTPEPDAKGDSPLMPCPKNELEIPTPRTGTPNSNIDYLSLDERSRSMSETQFHRSSSFVSMTGDVELSTPYNQSYSNKLHISNKKFNDLEKNPIGSAETEEDEEGTTSPASTEDLGLTLESPQPRECDRRLGLFSNDDDDDVKVFFFQDFDKDKLSYLSDLSEKNKSFDYAELKEMFFGGLPGDHDIGILSSDEAVSTVSEAGSIDAETPPIFRFALEEDSVEPEVEPECEEDSLDPENCEEDSPVGLDPKKTGAFYKGVFFGFRRPDFARE